MTRSGSQRGGRSRAQKLEASLHKVVTLNEDEGRAAGLTAALIPAEVRRLEPSMNLDVTELENGITQIALSGRLDVEGALKIDGEFNQIAEQKKNVLVDLSGVTFIASLGIRTLITGAKATANNGGKMVLLNPQSNVERVLRTSRVDTVIPIIDDASAIEPVFGS